MLRAQRKASEKSGIYSSGRVAKSQYPAASSRRLAPGPHRACPGGAGLMHKKDGPPFLRPTGLAPVARGLCTRKTGLPFSAPPGLPRWSGGFCTRRAGPSFPTPTGLAPVESRLVHKKGGPPLLRPHRACPGGAQASAPAGGSVLPPRGGTSPRSTGASPVGASDRASHALVHKPPLHRGKPGGGRAQDGPPPEKGQAEGRQRAHRMRGCPAVSWTVLPSS